MAQAICSIEGCDKPVKGHGWCGTHYRRWYIHGDPNHPAKRGPVPTLPHKRVLAKVRKQDDGCWIYTGALNNLGYGTTNTGEQDKGTKKPRHVHRVVYEALVGPIPPKTDVHHVCRVRSCCNPDHLELIPHAEHGREHGVEAVAKRWGYKPGGPCHYCGGTDFTYRKSGRRDCVNCKKTRWRS